jgi:DNA helicase-2/ATP-dependent DNA helicase PcrA
LPHNLQYIRRAGSTRDEKIRLFFVAVSRAKTQLYLTNYDQDYSGKTYGSLAFMQESEQEDGNVVSNILPASRATVRHNKEKGVPAEAVASYWYQRHIDGLTDNDFKKLLQPLLDGFQLSPTHLGTFTDLVYGGPQQFYLRNILKFPGAASPDSKYGDAMHETMYDVHKHLRSNHDLPEPEEVQKMFEARLLMKRLSAADHERHLQRGAQALEVFLPAWWQNFLLESEHERDFRDEGSFVGKAHLTGRLDQLMKNTDDKDIYIIDITDPNPVTLPKFDLVVSFDTFEHLPEEKLANVFAFLRSVGHRYYIKVATPETPDWQHDPTHITIQPLEFWQALFEDAIWEPSK